jgi:hypothetical protein
VLDDLNSNALAFVVHVGDLSSPPYACTDDLVAHRLAQFNASAHPFIYTPGDNEWTDCHEQQGVKGGNPLERLAHVSGQAARARRRSDRIAVPLAASAHGGSWHFSDVPAAPTNVRFQG